MSKFNVGDSVRWSGWWLSADEMELVKPASPKKSKATQAYKGNGKHTWEHVSGDTDRLRVPGGWLYCSDYNTTFVPMPAVVKHAI